MNARKTQAKQVMLQYGGRAVLSLHARIAGHMLKPGANIRKVTRVTMAFHHNSGKVSCPHASKHQGTR